MIIKFLFACFFILIPPFSFAEEVDLNFGSCIGDARVFYKHLRAVELLQNTKKLINNEDLNQNIVIGLSRYFKLNSQDASHAKLIKQVFETINKVSKKNHKTNYFCDYTNETKPCTDTNYAYAGKKWYSKKIYLCPGYFNTINEVQKVGVILHQWFHAWGGCKIAKRKEKFCRDMNNHSAKDLVKQADQYMLFIYFVGSNGSVLDCF